MNLYSNYHTQAHRFANSEIVEMFFFQIIKNIGTGIIGIFIPVYMYTHGLSLFEVMTVFTIYTVLHGLCALWFGRYIIFKMGIKHTFVLAVLLQAVSFLILKQGVDIFHICGWLLVVGFMDAIYATTHHSYIALNIDETLAGKEVAALSSAAILAGVITPLVGALLILMFGFQNTFLIGSLFLILSILPLFFSAEIDISKQVYLSGCKHLSEFRKSDRPVYVSTIGNGFNGASAPLWDSLYMYNLLGGLTLLGALSSVVSAIQICASYFGGSRSDKHQSVFRAGINGSIFARMFTLISFHPYIAMMSETVDGVVSPLFSTAYHANFYKSLKGNYVISRAAAHESVWHGANTFAMVLITVAVYFFGWYAFLIAGMFMVGGRLIIRQQKVGLR